MQRVKKIANVTKVRFQSKLIHEDIIKKKSQSKNSIYDDLSNFSRVQVKDVMEEDSAGLSPFLKFFI